jgi:excisionase family DNA binding protein
MELHENRVYTVKEAEQILKISPSTMHRLLKKNLIRAAKVGKQYRILGKEILRVLSPRLEDKVGKAYNKARTWVHEGL